MSQPPTMASETEDAETETNEQSLLARLINSRNRGLSLLLPIVLGLTNTPNSTNPIQESTNPIQDSTNPVQETPEEDSRDRIILIDALTQGMVVIEGSSSSLDSLLRELLSKDGQPPASKASIEAMPSVEIDGEEGGGCECVICLEEWVIGGVAKEMPCKHRFHGECIDKWLGIHGSCPVCRYKMPVDDDDDLSKKIGEERERRRSREIWVSFSFNRDRTESNQTPF